MDVAAQNQRIASALFRAGLLDEGAIRRALEEARGQDLGAFLVRGGRLRPEDLQRALSRPSGAFPTAPPPATGRPSGRQPALGPTGTVIAAPAAALDLTVRTGPPAAALAPDLDLTIRTGPPRPTPGGPASTSGAGHGSATGLGSRTGSGSFLGGALNVAPGEDVPPGTQLGNYVVKRLLAKGGMGAVFVAEHAMTRRPVALKVLLAGEGATDEQLARFLVEARTSSRLNHPNVVPVYEVGEAGGVHFMTMELVDGPSLRQVIREAGPLPPRRALHLVEQVARGVAAAHGEKIIHRDLKPHNVLVAKDDVAKVMDFGLAKEADHAGQGLTVSGALLGTPSYMAPEQAAGEKVGALADVYGLGAILYECLTGKPPHEGSTLANIITRVISQDVVPPRQVRPAIHADVETICLKALEKDPRKRYPSARALADDLGRWLAGEAIQARPITGPERARRWAKRNVPLVAGGAVALPVLVFLAVWFLIVAPRRDAALAAATAERLIAERATEDLDAFRATYREQRATIDAARAAVIEAAQAPDGAGLEDALAEALDVALPAAAGRIAEARAKLGAEARSVADADPALAGVDVGLERASLWRELAASYPGAPKEKVDEANAFAYAAAPTTDEGLLAMGELLRGRESAAAAAVADELLSLQRGLPPRHEVLLRTWRAERRISRCQLTEAAQDVVRVEALLGTEHGLGADELPRVRQMTANLRAFLWPMLTSAPLTIERPGAEGRAAEVTQLRPLRGAAGERARLEVVFGDGAAALCELAAGPPPRLEVTALIEPVSVERRPGEGVALSAHLPSRDRPLAACFMSPTRRLVLTDGRGEQLWSVQRQADAARLLEFMELDDDPRTAHLVLVMGPNQGDSIVLRVAADGRVTQEDLDLAGRNSPRLQGAQCYVEAAVCVPTTVGPRLVLAYGAWGANCLRVLREERGRLVPCGPEVEVGHIQALQYVPGRDGRPWLVAAHQENEEAFVAERWTPRGIAIYGLDGDRIVRAPLALLERAAPAVADWGLGYQDLVLFQSDVTYAVLNQVTGYRSGRDGRTRVGRFLVARLDAGAERLVVDVPLSEAWAGSRTTGDFLGVGRDQLVQHVKDLELRLLGAPGKEPEVPPEAPPSLTPERAEARATGHLDALGFQGPVLARLRAREAAVGATRETELVGLAVLTDAERKRGYGPADRVFATDADFERLSLAFAEDTNRSPDARARTFVLRAQHHLRAGTEEAARRALEELTKVPPGFDLSGEGLQAQVLARELVRLRLPGSNVRQSIDFAQPRTLTELVATNPVRLQLVGGRGVVARFNRREALVAGVPVTIPEGPVRLTLEYEIDGTTWQGTYDVGLLRAANGDLEAGEDIECLSLRGSAWLATADPRRAAHHATPSFGAPKATLRRPTDLLPFRPALGFPLTVRAALRVTLEHDPRTRWSHVRIVEATTDTVLYDRDGVSERSLSPGRYLAGLRTDRTKVADLQGANFPPDACLTLKHITLETLERAWRAADARDVGSGAAVGAALRAAALGGDGATEALAAVGAEADASPPRRRAKLRLGRADLRVRLGDAARARDDVTAAWADGAFPFFRAIEDLGARLQPGTRALVRDLVRRQRLELDRRVVDRPTDRALWEARAVVHRLRGEARECLEALDRAEALAGADATRAQRLWLRAALSLDPPTSSALGAAWPASEHPERAELMPSFWAPLDEAVDGAAAARAEVERLLATGQVDVAELDEWLTRSVELAPTSADAWAQRARLTEMLIAQGIRQAHFFHRALADARRACELAPEDPQLAVNAAVWELRGLDVLGAGERLRALRRQGDVRQLLDPLGKLLPADDAPAFQKAVAGTDAEWAAYRRRLIAGAAAAAAR